eukprot:8743798-Pyramimonas_sp.AAC.1
MQRHISSVAPRELHVLLLGKLPRAQVRREVPYLGTLKVCRAGAPHNGFMRSSGASDSVSVRTLCLLPRSARHSSHSPPGEFRSAAMSAHPPVKRSPQ